MNAEENQTKAGLIGTISEEGSHIIGKLEGRQIETGTYEKGLESTGRATNEYFKEKYRNDRIELASDGRDYSGLDFGEWVGDAGGACLGGKLLERCLNYNKTFMNKVNSVDREAAAKSISLILDLTPVAGDIKGVIESVRGKDLLTNEELSLFSTVLGLMPLVKPAVKGTKAIIKIMKKGKTAEVLLADGSKIALKADDVAKLEKTAKNVKKIEKATLNTVKQLTKNQIKNMSLEDIKKLGELGTDKGNTVARFLEGTKEDAIKFFENRIVSEGKSITTPKGVIRTGYDKFGNKVVYRGFSSTGGSYPTIDIYDKTMGKSIIREIKFRKGK